MYLSVAQVAKTYGPSQILNDISFILNAAERVGLVGANGAGKSTLLRIVAGELEADAGVVSVARGVTLGYLPQQPPEPAGSTVEDLLYEAVGELRQLEIRLRELEGRLADPRLSAAQHEADLAEYGVSQERFERRGGYDLDYRIDIVLQGLRIAHVPRERRFSTLSGGEKSRVLLASLLLRAPDLLLLDEPTNHLDFASIAWLERYLADYQGACLVISHDRHFLNGAVKRILEIDEHAHGLREYVGDYDAYMRAKAKERERWEVDYAEQLEEIKELKRAIRVSARNVAPNRPRKDPDKAQYDFKAGRVAIAVSRNVRNAEERLKRIEADPIPKPPDLMRISPEFDVDELRAADIVHVEGVTKAFRGAAVLRDVSFTLGPRARVVLVGPNGAGKSTLLNILAGALAPDAGAVRIAAGARLGYLDQDARAANGEQTVLAAYRDGLVGYEDEFVRDLFRYGLFTLDDLSKQVGQLSAGQRRKLQLARLIATRANVLLLDEPTNHLSFDILEEFERALGDFAGPILAVSHDRWFIQRFGGHVWELRDGALVQHAGPAADALAELLRRDAAHGIEVEVA
jgi:macrolide transport system ATP-binding/permease protein